MMHFFQKTPLNFFNSLLPSAISIIQAESLYIFIHEHNSIQHKNTVLVCWILLQSIMGVVYGNLSDKKSRKKILIFVQLIGIATSLALIFHQYHWIIPVILGGFYSPLPIAKATLLDNFSNYSPLRIIALTYIFQYFPWVMNLYIKSFNPSLFIIMQIILFIINIVLTCLLVQDEYKVGHKLSHPILKKKPMVRQVLTAFLLAEIAFYFLWSILEQNLILETWFAPITYASILGIIFAMIYSKITHMSIITLSYFGCFGGMLLAVFFYFNLGHSIIPSMSAAAVTCIFGGLYLPFVTDAIIMHFGGKRKAYATSIVEFVESLARVIGMFIPIMGLLRTRIIFKYNL